MLAAEPPREVSGDLERGSAQLGSDLTFSDPSNSNFSEFSPIYQAPHRQYMGDPRSEKAQSEDGGVSKEDSFAEWMEAIKDGGHLMYWLNLTVITIPIFMRLIFFNGSVTYKSGRMVGFDDLDSTGHVVQGFFCCIGLFTSHTFNRERGIINTTKVLKPVMTGIYLSTAVVYITYNFIKRMITDTYRFADSSFFSNQADLVVGHLIGYGFLLIFSYLVRIYDEYCSQCHISYKPFHDFLLRWKKPFFRVHPAFVEMEKAVFIYSMVLQTLVIIWFFVTIDERKEDV